MSDLKAMLDEQFARFANADFIDTDPILIPKSFSQKEDIEIAAFLTATIAWGQRKSIITNAQRMMELMDHQPSDFIRNHQPADRKPLSTFVHRTFNGDDLIFFAESLQNIYLNHGGLEHAFGIKNSGMNERLGHFHRLFFSIGHLPRNKKHVSNAENGSAAKRLNMFLRWMVRPNTEGIDFGLWKTITPAELMMPLDVHTSTVGRALGLLHRKQDDWKAVEELTAALRQFDPVDPVRYDLALFGMGVNSTLKSVS